MEDFSFFRLRFFGTTIIHSLAVSLYINISSQLVTTRRHTLIHILTPQMGLCRGRAFYRVSRLTSSQLREPQCIVTIDLHGGYTHRVRLRSVSIAEARCILTEKYKLLCYPPIFFNRQVQCSSGVQLPALGNDDEWVNIRRMKSPLFIFFLSFNVQVFVAFGG